MFRFDDLSHSGITWAEGPSTEELPHCFSVHEKLSWYQVIGMFCAIIMCATRMHTWVHRSLQDHETQKCIFLQDTFDLVKKSKQSLKWSSCHKSERSQACKEHHSPQLLFVPSGNSVFWATLLPHLPSGIIISEVELGSRARQWILSLGKNVHDSFTWCLLHYLGFSRNANWNHFEIGSLMPSIKKKHDNKHW